MSDDPTDAPTGDASRAIADLYQLEPSGFVAARDDLVRAQRKAGDKDTAREVAALRRPTPAAWGLNRLARERADLIDRVVELGAVWQEASATGDRDGTRAAQADLRTAIDASLDEVARLTADGGRPPGQDDLEAIRATLQAAALDDELAGAVRAGTLQAPTTGLGFGGLGVGAFGASPDAGASDRRARPTARATPRSKARSEKTAAGDEAEAEAEAEAERRRAEAQAEAQAERARRQAEAERLTAEAETLAAEADRAEAAATTARRAADEAASRAADAKRAAHQGGRRLGRRR